MNTEQILDTVKKSAGTPAGKIAILAVGGYALYRVLSSRSGSGSAPMKVGGGALSGVLPSSAGASPSGSGAGSGASLSDQLAILEKQALLQLDINKQSADYAELSRQKTALFDVELAGKKASAELSAMKNAAMFWFSDLDGNYSKTLYSTNAPVSERGRTPGRVSNNIGATVFDLFSGAQRQPSIDAANIANAQQQTQFQQQLQLLKTQGEINRANQPKQANTLNLIRDVAAIASVFSGGRSTPVPANTQTIVVPPSIGGTGSVSSPSTVRLPGWSDTFSAPSGLVKVA